MREKKQWRRWVKVAGITRYYQIDISQTQEEVGKRLNMVDTAAAIAEVVKASQERLDKNSLLIMDLKGRNV